MNKLMFASVISEIEQSDIFMTVKARICEAPAANLNGARVTEAFIDEIVDNEDRYVGLPLYADVRTLINGNYRRLGHLYDSKTGEFHSTQIGSFYQFEKEEFDGGCYLVGYARIAKRNRKLSKAISELFADGNLKFSFEVNVGEYDEMDDGTIMIDAAETNYLEGTAIVSFPACKDAVALQLVAQQENTEGGEGEMLKKKEPTVETAEENVTVNEIASDEAIETAAETVVETAAESTEETAEEVAEVVEQAAEVAEEATAEQETETIAETAEAVETEATQENAEVSVYENHTEIHETEIHDYQNNEHVSQRVTIETRTGHEEEGNLVETDDGMAVAETAVAEGEDPVVEPVVEPAPEPEAEDEPAPEDQKKTAEQLIAELAETVNALRQEIAELKEPKKVVAEEPKTYNLLMADIKAENKYGLLEKEPRTNSYSLLSK